MIDRVSADGLTHSVAKDTRTVLPPLLAVGLLALVAAGIVALIALLWGSDPGRGWRIYHVNFVFWSGAAISGVVVAAIFQVTSARWPDSIRTLAEATAAYLPAALLLFIVSWFGRYKIFSWADPNHPATSPWLTTTFLYTREAIGLLLLSAAGMILVYRSLRGSHRASLTPLAVGVLFLYVIVFTMFAWDFVMSLDPAWSSTLFGGYFLVGNLYVGWALLTAAAVWVHFRSGPGCEVNAAVFRNLGSLILSFSLLWSYLLWSQYLVIWYGNLPREIRYVLARTEHAPWRTITLMVLLMNFLIPFVVFLSRAAKTNPKVLLGVAGTIIAGIWLERFLLVMPALALSSGPVFGWPELIITIGFLASFLLIYLTAISRISRLGLSHRNSRA